MGQVRSARAYIATLLLASACQLGPSDAVEDIGGTWTVVRVGNQPSVPMSEPRLQFTDGDRRVVGETGCSDLDAGVVIEGNTIRVDQIRQASADPPCANEVRRFEAVFLDAFRRVQAVERATRRLILTGTGGEVLMVSGTLELTEDERALAAGLQGVEWAVVEATGLPNPAALPPLTFDAGVLAASGPCGFEGRYRLRGEDLIHLYQISWAQVDECSPAAQHQRAVLAKRLEKTTRLAHDADGQRVTLDGLDGEVILRRAAPPSGG